MATRQAFAWMAVASPHPLLFTVTVSILRQPIRSYRQRHSLHSGLTFLPNVPLEPDPPFFSAAPVLTFRYPRIRYAGMV